MTKGFTRTLKTLKHDNLESSDYIYIAAESADTYTTGSVSASTDPFTSKTNKYCEKAGVILVGTAAFHVQWGNASITDATTSDFYWPANKPLYLACEPDNAYMRVIPNTGSATIFATEVGLPDPY
jgi:hypothetical protein